MNEFIFSKLQCNNCGIDTTLYFGNEEMVCDKCKQVYFCKDGNIFFVKENQSVGSKYARSSDKKNWSSWRQSNLLFLKETFLNIPKDSILVDLGSGESPFSEVYDDFKYKINVDFTNYKEVDIITDLTKRVPLKSSIADVIISTNTLEHIPNTDHYLSECFRILKNGGLLLITVPFMIPIHQEPYDFLRFTNYQLLYILNKNGFRNIQIKQLSKFYEIYFSIQNDFLNQAVLQENKLIYRFLFRAFRKFNFLVLKLFSKKLNKIDSIKYSKGYGVIAYK